jgi:hypothetical protein
MDAKQLFTFSETEFSSFGLKLECAKAYLANSNISTQLFEELSFFGRIEALLENLIAECYYCILGCFASLEALNPMSVVMQLLRR